MHQERYISEKVAAMWNYPTRSSAVAGNPTRPIWTSCLSPFKAVCLRSKEKEIIDRIAVVNVKKSNGGSESEYEDLKKYALEDRLEIKRELEIIQPDIIVCGNNLSLLKLVLGEELQNDDTWDNMLALWKDTLVLDYYHPAVHYPNRVNYYALMAICDVARKKYGTPVWSEQNEKY